MRPTANEPFGWKRAADTCKRDNKISTKQTAVHFIFHVAAAVQIRREPEVIDQWSSVAVDQLPCSDRPTLIEISIGSAYKSSV